MVSKVSYNEPRGIQQDTAHETLDKVTRKGIDKYDFWNPVLKERPNAAKYGTCLENDPVMKGKTNLELSKHPTTS